MPGGTRRPLLLTSGQPGAGKHRGRSLHPAFHRTIRQTVPRVQCGRQRRYGYRSAQCQGSMRVLLELQQGRAVSRRTIQRGRNLPWEVMSHRESQRELFVGLLWPLKQPPKKLHSVQRLGAATHA